MIINFLIKEDKEQVEKDEPAKVNNYVYVEIHRTNGEKINQEIDFKDFKKEYEKIDNQIESPFDELPLHTKAEGVLTEEKNSNKENKRNIGKLDRIINFFKKYDLDFQSYFQAENEEIRIRSNFDEILHLPWEEKFNKNIKWIREVVTNGSVCSTRTGKSLMIACSHSYFEIDSNYRKIYNDFSSESSKILQALWGDKTFLEKPLYLQVVKHLSKKIFADLNLSNFQILHFMMHGKFINGSLGFEMDQDHSKIDWFDKKEFTENLKMKTPDNRFLLICFASCYSAYGNFNDPSLAFLTVQNNLSKYCIGFDGSMGSEESLPCFSEVFYECLFQDKSIEDCFFHAVSRLRNKPSKYWHRPTLYKTATL